MKYSNALNKPWFKIDEDGMITDMANDVYEDIAIVDVMNDSTEKAILNANKINMVNKFLSGIVFSGSKCNASEGCSIHQHHDNISRIKEMLK